MKKRKSALRVAGLRGLNRRAYRPPDDLSRNFDDLGPLDGGHILADSFLTLCYPAGGDNGYPYSAGGYESRDPKSSVESPARGGPRMPFTGAGSSVTPECNACWPASKD